MNYTHPYQDLEKQFWKLFDGSRRGLGSLLTITGSKKGNHSPHHDRILCLTEPTTSCLTERSRSAFQGVINQFYQQHGRPFPWRESHSPYEVFISEVMLQQTQTHRVIPKYEAWLKVFPNFKVLAEAPQSAVIAQWQGLGYNRRARFLHQSAQLIVSNWNGQVPEHPDDLVTLPGIGKATAASIAAFAYNEPTVFIETNIRTVFLYFFFQHRLETETIHDNELMPLIEQTLDVDCPREWYYALMDYGVMLKKEIGNLNRKSKQYVKQSTFKGSDRQIRGRVLRALLSAPMALDDLLQAVTTDANLARSKKIVTGLQKEGFITIKNGVYCLQD